MKSSITLLILAYNEQKNLENTVHNCDIAAKDLFQDYELLICDDGSLDLTGDIAERLAAENPKVRVFHNKKNIGAGCSYLKGIRLARKKYVMWVPGDNEVAMNSIKNLLKHTGQTHLVISYIKNTTVRPLYRQIISTGFVKFMNLIFNLDLRHFLGIILCETKLVRKLKLTTTSSCVMAEIIIKLIKTGHTYKQVPIIARKKRMSINIFRPKNVFGLTKTVMYLFVMFQIRKSKDIFKH